MAVSEHDDKAGPDEADARIAGLYRDASREEPPARLDRVIARAARAPVDRLSEPQRVPWWLAWRVPFAVAALAVVSVSLVTLMVEEDADRVTRIPPSSPAASEPAPAKKETPSVPAPARAPEPKPERAVEPAEARREDDARTSQGRAAPDAAMRAPMSEGPPPAEAAAAATGADARMRASQKAPSADAAPSAVYDAAREPARDVVSPPPPPRLEGPGASIDDRAGVAPQAARRSAMPAAKPASPGPVQAPSPAAKPAPAPPATIGIRGLESEAVSLARASPEVAKHLVELDREPPAVWIERVLALRKQGRFAEAEGVLAEFRQRYPRVPLPPDLQ